MIRTIALCVALFATTAAAALAGEFPAASPERLAARIKALSQFGANPDGGVDRVAYSPADIAGRAYIKGLMEELGLEARVDNGGNIIGRRQGREPDLPPIMFGSHIDSVPGGGNYDGDVGVISALEVIDLLNAAGHVTRHPLEVVVFSNEEGGLVGSLVMIGALKPNALDVVSHSGLTIRDGIEVLGGDSKKLAEAALKPGEIKAFIELHIEQGAILDEAEIEIGVVEGIVGIRWWDVTIDGFANHAGTTPMNQRRDAMVAAARLTLAVNQVALEMPGRQVATVGRIRAEPGAPNVIPGRVVMSLEVRDLELSKMEQVFAEIEKRAAGIAEETGTSIRFDLIDVDSHPEPTDPRLRRIIARVAQMYGYSFKLMPSGAGHDAQDLATIAPTGMIFVPSRGGISHSPKEFTSPRHMANGADVLLGTVLAIDQGALDD